MDIIHNEALCSGGLRVSSPVPGIIRVTDGRHKKSYMVSAALRKRAPSVEGEALCWGKLRLEPENGMALYYDGKLLSRDHTGERTIRRALTEEELALMNAEGHAAGNDADTEKQILVIKELPADACIYGLGDKTGFLNKRHYAYVNWNTDDPTPHCDNYVSLYKSINFFMVFSSSGCLGILADNSFRTAFDFGKENDGYYWWCHDGGCLDYYMLPGRDPAEVLKKYYTLTGTGELHQKWAYGFHQSRWSYETPAELLAVADRMRAERLPMDAIHMDIDYMEGFRVFTFGQKNFPEPEKVTAALAERNVKAIAIIDPGVKIDPAYFMYAEGMEKGFFARNPDGSVYEGAVWPGPAVFPDFTRKDCRDWWGEKTGILLKAGIRGIWNDMNEPANFTGQLPGNVRFREGTHEEIHNVYGHLMAQATCEGLKKQEDRRPFVLTRACCAGSQRYCAGWTGDNNALWAHLQLSLTQMMNLGLSGMNMVGSDVGGFGADTTPELLIRWFQLGAISPFYRDHYAKGTRPQEAYAFDRATMDACRESLDLRYRLLPYIYDLAHEQLPILRPLVLEFPEDSACRSLTDQCMVGPWLLAAPVMTPGVTARAVYLPKGVWYDYYTGRKISGGRYILAEAPLDRMPLFVRAGAAIPVSVGKPQCVEEITEVKLLVYPGRGRTTHYMDDGETLAYQRGALRRIGIRVNGRAVTQEVLQSGFPGPDELPFEIMG